MLTIAVRSRGTWGDLPPSEDPREECWIEREERDRLLIPCILRSIFCSHNQTDTPWGVSNAKYAKWYYYYILYLYFQWITSIHFKTIPINCKSLFSLFNALRTQVSSFSSLNLSMLVIWNVICKGDLGIVWI